MTRRYLIGLVVGIIAIAATAGGFTVSAMGDSGDGNATGPEADAAAAAAIELVGGGTLLEVEHGDDHDAVWEVEVKTSSGEELEVLLDGNLNEIARFANDDDDEGEDDDDDEDEDGEDDDDDSSAAGQ